MNRENLETRIKELGVLIEEASGNVKKLVDEQTTLTKDLEDLNKPKLTDDQWNEVQRIVEMSCETFDPDLGESEYELELNYDNTVVCIQICSFQYQCWLMGDKVLLYVKCT